jgi:outer membrane protein
VGRLASLFFGFAIFHAPVAAAQPGPTSVTLDAARAALERGATAEAANILASTDANSVDRNDFDFLRGTLAVAQGRYDDGITAFRELLARDPKLNRVRLDLAQAYFLNGDDRAAEFHFRAALAQGVPSEVRRNVERYLIQIRDRSRWDIVTSLALAPDTNINTATSAESIDVFGLPFLLDPSAQGRSGVGVTAGFGVADRWPINSSWKLRTAASAVGTAYGASQFNDYKFDAEIGPALQLTEQVEVSVLTTTSRRWFGNDELLSGIGTRIEAVHTINPRWQVAGAVGWENRAFVSAYAPYSGPVYATSFTVAHAINATSSALGFTAVVREDTRDPSVRAWQYIGGATINRENLWGRFALQLGVQAALIRYDEPSFLFTKARRETQLEYRIGFSHAAFDVWGFTPVVSLIRTDRYANIALYSYHRTRAEIGLRRIF